MDQPKEARVEVLASCVDAVPATIEDLGCYSKAVIRSARARLLVLPQFPLLLCVHECLRRPSMAESVNEERGYAADML